MTMKKSIFILFVLVLCLSLTSCGVVYNPYVYFDSDILFNIDQVPDYSENFDEEFFKTFDEDYTFEPRYAFYSASVWEAEEESEIEDIRTYKRFSMIDGFENKEFVAVSNSQRWRFPILECSYSWVYVARHKDAPDPMKDWTLKSISVIASDKGHDPRETNYATATDARYAEQTNGKSYITLEQLSVNQMSLFDTEEYRICTFDREHDAELLDAFIESYYSPTRIENFTGQFGLTGVSDTFRTEFYIIVHFEESDNIVWCDQLFRSIDSTELYSSSSLGGADHSVIKVEYAEKIIDSIWKWQEENR